jgi:DNA helicase-2/ATP-dependent DNA helicase PcrA
VGKVGRVISCVYCGGTHDHPSDVKRCWSDHQGQEQPAAASSAAPTLLDEPGDRPRPGDRSTPSSTKRRAPQHDTQHDTQRTTQRTTGQTGQAAQTGWSGPRAGGAVVVARRGPAVLGRNVVVAADADEPADWVGAPRVVIDRAVLDDPAPTAALLRAAADAARSVVIELTVEFDDHPATSEPRPAYEVGAGHDFPIDALHHLVWANSIDARDPESPHWRLVDLAIAVGARTGGDADIVLPDGSPAWLDGGPIRHVEPVDGTAVLHAVAVEHGSLTPPGVNRTTADLAPDQLAAVTHDTGTARIIAPAGSGKTRVLTERARHLIRVWNVPADAVCLVAFNKRAQTEISERTRDLPGLQVRTLNSIALAIVNGTPPFASRDERVSTIDEPAVRRLLQRFVSTPRRRNTDPMAPWIEALSLVRLGLVDPADAELRYGGDVDGLAAVFPQYQAALARERAVDFDGQIDRALSILLTDPAARRTAQRACRLLLVDEFQDLTPAHMLLVRLLAGPAGSVFAVGDDDQTIYGYNGADPGWLIDYARWFPGAGDHPLEVNYRCPGGVVEIADRLLRHNRRRVAKTIRARPEAPGTWRVAGGADPVDEALTAVQHALEHGATPAEIAVLTRVNATLAPIQVALIRAGIVVSGGVGTEFADRTAVRAALAWLRLASGRHFAADDLSEALRRPSRSLHPRIAEWVTEQRDVGGLQRLADRVNNERDSARLSEFASDIARLTGLLDGGAPTDRVVAALVDDVGLGGAVATLDDTRHGMNRGSQGDDLLAVRQLARIHARHDPSIPFETWLRDQLATRRDGRGVTLATVHRVKGQEWPHVVVHLAAADQFPHRLAADHEEERRLFHVAITRASSSVAIVTGEMPSPFVDELTTEPADPSEVPATAPAGPRVDRPVARTRRDLPDHPLLDRTRVMAVEGTVLVDQGHEWTVVALEPEAAVAERNGSTRRFRLGEAVETLGRQRGELRPRPGEVDAASALAFDRLRQFRDRARNGKPAYTVFDDKTLAAIAQRLPASLDELARVKGVGPAKLEQYGDTVLGVIADVMST